METDLVSATVYFRRFEFSGDKTMSQAMEYSFPNYQRSQENFVFCTANREALGPPQVIQLVLGTLSL